MIMKYLDGEAAGLAPLAADLVAVLPLSSWAGAEASGDFAAAGSASTAFFGALLAGVFVAGILAASVFLAEGASDLEGFTSSCPL